MLQKLSEYLMTPELFERLDRPILEKPYIETELARWLSKGGISTFIEIYSNSGKLEALDGSSPARLQSLQAELLRLDLPSIEEAAATVREFEERKYSFM